MRKRRPGLALTFIVGAIVLLVAIAVGQRLGDRVLTQATEKRVPIVGPRSTPVPELSDPSLEKNWKRQQVISVATDPAFPDPRVTKPPPPTPKPTPVPRPTEAPITPPPPAPPAGAPVYTSPPLPIPIASHAPNETQPEDQGGFPQGIPPVTSPPKAP